MKIGADGKVYNSMEEMFDDFDKQFHQEHPIEYWIDNTLFKGNGIGNYAAHHTLLHPWLLVEDGWDQVRWAWERIWKYWDSRVIWSIDWYLSDMIPVWIKELKKVRYGYPMTMFEGMTPTDTNTWSYSDEDEKLASKKWDDILDKIILGFESYHRIHNESLWENHPEYKELNENFEIGFDLFRKYFEDLWD
jgi:hypothetical protein